MKVIDFYNNTNGSNWTNNTAWNTNTPVSSWYGVTTQVINNQEHVTGISFNDNNLFPSINTSIEDLTELREFFIVNVSNQFGAGGTIPAEVGNLQNLTSFWIENWNLQGSLPTEIGNLNTLEFLTIRGTSCSGTLPSSLANLNALFSLSLNSNQFSGLFPDITSISSSLSFLRIQDNLFQYVDDV